MAASIICSTWLGLVLRGARDEGGAGGDGLLHRVDRVIHRAPDVGLALEAERRGGRGLFLGQAVDPVVHGHAGQLDVLAGGVGEMIAADGEEVAVAAEDEDVQVGPGERDAAGEGQRAAVNVVRAVGLHEIREPAGAADAGDGGDLLLPQLALLDQLEVEREHGEIAAAGTPGRDDRRRFPSWSAACVRRRAGRRLRLAAAAGVSVAGAAHILKALMR